MLVCRTLAKEHFIACFTRNLGCPVTKGVHVLIRCILGHELSGASFAFEARGPMIRIIHMLVAGTPSTKGSGASFAFRPVVIFIHMVLPLRFPVEGVCTRKTLIHCGWRG